MPQFDDIVAQDNVLFLDQAGVPVEYTTSERSLLNIMGIFTDGYASVDLRDGVEVSSQELTLEVNLADFVSDSGPATPPQQHDMVTIQGRQFEVIDVQRDGFGLAKLILDRADSRRQ